VASTITGDTELKRKLAKLKDFSQLKPVLIAGASHMYGIASYYPALAGQKRQAGLGSSWYVRGRGTQYMKKDGTISNYGGSQDLGQRWTQSILSDTKAIIGNNVDYGPYVKDPNLQSKMMEDFNWKTTDEDVREGEPKVLELFKNKVDQILATG
jgi:hypothetical protein